MQKKTIKIRNSLKIVYKCIARQKQNERVLNINVLGSGFWATRSFISYYEIYNRFPFVLWYVKYYSKYVEMTKYM